MHAWLSGPGPLVVLCCFWLLGVIALVWYARWKHGSVQGFRVFSAALAIAVAVSFVVALAWH